MARPRPSSEVQAVHPTNLQWTPRPRRVPTTPAGIHDHDLLFSQRPQEVAPTAQEGDKILSQMSRGGERLLVFSAPVNTCAPAAVLEGSYDICFVLSN